MRGPPAAIWALEMCRVHDLRHTCGRSLRAAGVSFENRQDLLGHKSNRITDHYCKAEIKELQDAVEKLCRVTNIADIKKAALMPQ